MSNKNPKTNLYASRPQWRVNTPGLLKEILTNSQTQILRVPLRIFADLLSEVAERAIKLDDPKLNLLMCRLALFEQSDPYSEHYDPRTIAKAIRMAAKHQQ